MSDMKEEGRRPSLKDLIPEQKTEDEIELEGHHFEVAPVTVGLMKKLSAADVQDVLDRDVGLQALQETATIGGKKVVDVLLAELSEASKQQLAMKALASNGFGGGGTDALAALGATLKDRKNLFAIPESLNIGKTIAAQLEGMQRASLSIAGLTKQIRPDFNVNRIDLQDRPSILNSLDLGQSPQARSADAAEATQDLMKDMLAAQGLMLKHMGELADSIIQVALPQWLDQIKSAEEEAKKSADRANKSLLWAVLAVIVSVACTVGTTVYDSVQSAGDDVRFNTRADAVESLLSQQLGQNSRLLEAIQQGRGEQSEQLSAIQDQVKITAQIQEGIKASLSKLPAGAVTTKKGEQVQREKRLLAPEQD
jgi:hypothetical protein